jgi:hypothetical protein
MLSVMARRITAALAIVVLIWVLLLLLWTVERHRERSAETDEPASVALGRQSEYYLVINNVP